MKRDSDHVPAQEHEYGYGHEILDKKESHGYLTVKGIQVILISKELYYDYGAAEGECYAYQGGFHCSESQNRGYPVSQYEGYDYLAQSCDEGYLTDLSQDLVVHVESHQEKKEGHTEMGEHVYCVHGADQIEEDGPYYYSCDYVGKYYRLLELLSHYSQKRGYYYDGAELEKEGLYYCFNCHIMIILVKLQYIN